MMGNQPTLQLKSKRRLIIKTINLKGRIFFKRPLKDVDGKLFDQESNIAIKLYRNGDTFLNLTGLKKFSQIRQISFKLKTTINNPPVGFCIDCCFLSLKAFYKFNIKNLYFLLKNILAKKYFCSYEPELFPG